MWHDSPLMAFDLETTSIDPSDAKIVEMGLVIDSPVGEYETTRWLVNPGIEIPLEATAVHGISTEEAVNKGMPVGEAIDELIRVMNVVWGMYGDMPVCIFNAPYDLEILFRESEGLTGHNWTVIDPLVCDRSLDKYRSGRRTLTAISAAYGVGIKGAHQSTGDAICTIKLARAMGIKYPRFGKMHPKALHIMQEEAYKEWAEQYRGYRRKNGDDDFDLNTQWPFKGAEKIDPSAIPPMISEKR